MKPSTYAYDESPTFEDQYCGQVDLPRLRVRAFIPCQPKTAGRRKLTALRQRSLNHGAPQLRCDLELADRDTSQLRISDRISVLVAFCNLAISDHELEDVDVLIGGTVLSDVIAP